MPSSSSVNTVVCASDAQVEIIESQLDGEAEVAVEPMRRDTFPAVMLSCAYLLSEKGAGAGAWSISPPRLPRRDSSA